MLSFVTNATLQDRRRLDIFIPHVLDVFGPYIDELIIVMDRKPEEGRIKKLHATIQPGMEIDDDYISSLKLMDDRVKIVDCDYSRVKEVGRKWFNHSYVNRCQGGTPIFAFIYGIEVCKNDYIVRSDCDILFLDQGFIKELLADKKYDIVQLPRLNNSPISFSSRVFFINRSAVELKLPLKLYRLDILRQVHRQLLGRTTFLAFEQIVELNIFNKKLSVNYQTTNVGRTMHIPKREDFGNGSIRKVVEKFISGNIPEKQLQHNHDYQKELWENGLIKSRNSI
jgi:hypothetical protein